MPELELERHLHIRDILRQRIEEIHQTIGEDAAILEPDEQLNPDAMYAIYEGDGKKLEAIEDALESAVDLDVQEAEDLLRRIKRQQPDLFKRITSLPNAIRSAKNVTQKLSSVASTEPAVFFFGQAGDFQRLWLADSNGNIISEDNHSALTAIACPASEPRRPLPANFNVIVSKLKAEFDHQYNQYLAAGGVPHRLSPAQRWALDLIRDAHRQAATDAERDRLERLRLLWSVSPLDGRAEFALRGLRSKKADTPTLINDLEALAFERKLDTLAGPTGRDHQTRC